MQPIAELRGSYSQIELFLGSDSCPSDAPLVCASEIGYSSLGSSIAGHESRPAIKQLAEWMRDADEGAYVALVDAPPAPRRLALVQGNRSSGDHRNFYERNAPDKRIWRDFYYATTYGLFEEIDSHWAAADVELSHPTGFGWLPDLLPTVLDALGQLADRQPALAVRRVHLSCLHDLSELDVLRAVSTLNAEQRTPQAHEHFAIAIDEVALETVLPSGPPNTRLLHVPIVARSRLPSAG
jgi:hypothetical protein